MASPKNCSTLCPRCGSTFDLLSWSTRLSFLSSGFEDAEVFLPRQHFNFLSSSCCYCRSLRSISPPDFVFIFAATGSRYLLGRFDSLELHESTKSSKNGSNKKREAGRKDKQTLGKRLEKTAFYCSRFGLWNVKQLFGGNDTWKRKWDSRKLQAFVCCWRKEMIKRCNLVRAFRELKLILSWKFPVFWESKQAQAGTHFTAIWGKLTICRSHKIRLSTERQRMYTIASFHVQALCPTLKYFPLLHLVNFKLVQTSSFQWR